MNKYRFHLKKTKPKGFPIKIARGLEREREREREIESCVKTA